MTDKNRDGRDDNTFDAIKDINVIKPGYGSRAPFAPSAMAPRPGTTPSAPNDAPRTDGYSAGNPDGAENPGRGKSGDAVDAPKEKVARVVADVKAEVEAASVVVAGQDARSKALDARTDELDFARRELDGSKVHGPDGRASDGDHSKAGTDAVTEIDRQAVLNNKAKQDNKAIQEDHKAKLR